jgi:4-amino-4-deoxy-L-arabinose transferase-like glycosyltransferase
MVSTAPRPFPWRETAAYLLVALVPLALLLPGLGSQGLWDPWETHYAEVARRIVRDGDWITLRWHDELFFSKPVFLFWIIALSFRIFGDVEWAARLPVVLFSAAGLVGVFHYTRKSFGLVPGLVASLLLAVTPFWCMISRQAMTDIPCVAAMSVGLLAMGRVLYADDAGRANAWLAYACFGVATLAKGVLGFAIPGVVFFVMFTLTRSWGLLRRARLIEGAAIFCVVTLPWYVAVSILHGKAFLYEFFFLHHVARAGGGVHGERGTFEYFLSHLGWGLLPWTAVVVPSAVAFMARVRQAAKDPAQGQVLLQHLLIVVWAACAFGLFTISRTKFHHYIFPAAVPLAIMTAVWAVERMRGGASGWEKALLLFGILFGALLVRELLRSPDHLTFLFTYAYERPAGAPALSGKVAAAVLGTFAVGTALVLLRGRRGRAAGAVLAGGAAAFFAAYLVHGHMAASALHMSQKESFDEFAARKKPGDNFYNWKMNWRGEIYYSKDTIKKISRLEQLRPILAKPGRTFIISTIERYKQLDMEIERLRGKKLEMLNPHDLRYGFGLYDGPVLKAAPDPPLVKAVPDGAVKIAAAMGDGLLELAGYRVHARSAKIGDSFLVTLYWRAVKKTADHWIVFIHGDTYAKGESKRFNGNHVTGEGVYATERWMPGTLIEDTFAVCVDYGIPTGTYALYAGLYREKERLAVDEPWMHDGHNRVPLGDFLVTP